MDNYFDDNQKNMNNNQVEGVNQNASQNQETHEIFNEYSGNAQETQNQESEQKNPYVQGGRYNVNLNGDYNRNEGEEKSKNNYQNIYSHSSSGRGDYNKVVYGVSDFSNNRANNSNGFENLNYSNNEKAPKNGNGLGIASMVLGIVSIVLCCTALISLVCAIIGLILGIVSIVKKRNGFALAGIITSSFGIAFSVLMIVLVFVGEAINNLPGYMPNPEDSSGHEFAIKGVANSLKNFLGRK